MTEKQLIRLEELEELVQQLIRRIDQLEQDIRTIKNDTSDDWRR